MVNTIQQATLAGGCFWCLESAFNQVEGVLSARCGYAGGHLPTPSYAAVSRGDSGHAEVVRLSFDSSRIAYRDILEIFFSLHNPTQLNRQGNDVGTQYRSEIFYHNEQQRQAAEQIIHEIQQTGIWPDPVVTRISEVSNYFEAEDYHQDYFNKNPDNRYCNLVVAPKLNRFKQTFSSYLKQA